jgi:hypothetical protein
MFNNDNAGKKFTVDEVVALLFFRDDVVRDAVMALWQHQTEDEKATDNTHWRNRMGFNIPDAVRAGPLARKIMSGMELTRGELVMAQDMCYKYRRQLTRYANGG